MREKISDEKLIELINIKHKLNSIKIDVDFFADSQFPQISLDLQDIAFKLEDKLRNLAGIHFETDGKNIQEIISMITTEYNNRIIKKRNINCEYVIANLERKINNPEEYISDELWKTRNFYDKKSTRTIYLDSNGNKKYNI